MQLNFNSRNNYFIFKENPYNKNFFERKRASVEIKLRHKIRFMKINTTSWRQIQIVCVDTESNEDVIA